jgi:hypothetical protein
MGGKRNFYLLYVLNEVFNLAAERLLSFAIIQDTSFIELALFVEPIDNEFFRENILVTDQQLHKSGSVLQ